MSSALNPRAAAGLLVLLGSGCSEEPAEPAVVGCEGASIAASPADPASRGRFAVGARTVTLAGLHAEIWYPAPPGSDSGLEPKRYDLRELLPASERDKISDADNPWQICACHEGLPLDTGSGPYPLVVFLHGFGGYRAQSLELVTHWASRGFVVVAAEHPGLFLGDVLAPVCGGSAPEPDVPRDVRAMGGDLALPSGELAFLAGHLDATGMGLVGHSAGGAALEDLGDLAQVLAPMAARWDDGPATAPERTLVLGALEDQVVPYAEQQRIYQLAPAPKHLVGIAQTGHLAFSSLCALENGAGQNLVEVGEASGVCGLGLAGALFDCSEDYLPHEVGWEITRHATAAALETTLHCAPRALAELPARYPEVAELREE